MLKLFFLFGIFYKWNMNLKFLEECLKIELLYIHNYKQFDIIIWNFSYEEHIRFIYNKMEWNCGIFSLHRLVSNQILQWKYDCCNDRRWQGTVYPHVLGGRKQTARTCVLTFSSDTLRNNALSKFEFQPL